METGNINEILKTKILEWLRHEQYEPGDNQELSKELAAKFDFWVINQTLNLPAVSLKLFTQTLAKKLPYKRVGSGTVFLINKKAGDL